MDQDCPYSHDLQSDYVFTDTVTDESKRDFGDNKCVSDNTDKQNRYQEVFPKLKKTSYSLKSMISRIASMKLVAQKKNSA